MSLPNFLTALLAAAIAHGVLAQSAATTDPREFTEEARKVYAQSLKDARVLIAQMKFQEAIVTLDKLTAQRPREPQARFLKGVALADSGKPDEAIEVYRGVLGEYPELPEPRNNLAVLYARKGDYVRARDELEAAINAAPDYVIAYENLGDIYARLAELNYEKAIARDTRNKTAPAKLKLVRDALGPVSTAAPLAATSATAAAPPSAATTLPAPAAPAAAAATPVEPDTAAAPPGTPPSTEAPVAAAPAAPVSPSR
jgi:Flp pilus assembly protein TadD